MWLKHTENFVVSDSGRPGMTNCAFADFAMLSRHRENNMAEQGCLKHFGWGREGEGLTSAEEASVLARAESRFGP